jgi:predicted RNA binding protein YcfA (HicA-like mRNA interferase family)
VPGRLRVLSGADIVRILGRFDFQVVKQSGSHVKLRRTGPSGERQTLHIPLHRELKAGTLRAILRQSREFLPVGALEEAFFSD